ncbi:MULTISPECIES: hypothetical protein [unclassified Streptomyces]|uniref:hypothetical protein n=1 Tax=unclassified Streptomyces TaxID=2593676 RepID=UPI001331BC3B|nr:MULTISPECIES: hypothetical protein [unclassified Streptomyces]MCP3767686.1 hypothetical protein [Streptomyces sp. MAR25Y5]
MSDKLVRSFGSGCNGCGSGTVRFTGPKVGPPLPQAAEKASTLFLFAAHLPSRVREVACTAKVSSIYKHLSRREVFSRKEAGVQGSSLERCRENA